MIAVDSVPAPVSRAPVTAQRYPVEPALAAAKSVLRRTVAIEELGEFLAMSRATIYRRKADGLTEDEADKLACHLLGVHPYFVWSEWFDDVGRAADTAEHDADDVAAEIPACA